MATDNSPHKTNLNVELTGLAEPQRSADLRTEALAELADKMIAVVGGQAGTSEARYVRDLLINSAKLLSDGRGSGELKLITTAVKEMRYAFRVFAKYQDPHKITIFGSARTPETHPDFAACVEFSRLIAEQGWMVITGAGNGIMRAGHLGPGRSASFGVAIRLPFETNANEIIVGDEKLIHFRYFFTRKLMFLSQSEAVALFPGGFGTFDEAFETLTLVQTGKSGMVPIVCIEGQGGTFWKGFDRFVREELLGGGFISSEDTGLYKICNTPAEAVEHITSFYRIYHSSRYVKDDLVIRLKRPLTDAELATLNTEFKMLVKEGVMAMRGPYDVEEDSLELPRLAFTHTKSKFGVVRKLIDRINGFGG